MVSETCDKCLTSEEVSTSLEAKHANAAAACMDSHTLAPREAIH